VNALTCPPISADFESSFGCYPDVVVKAPGRVNIIGEHTDYNQGWVLPAAINYYTWIAASAREDRQLHVIAKDVNSEKKVIDLDAPQKITPEKKWFDYVQGVVQELQKQGYPLTGGNLLISGQIPKGAGLSSSASLEIALIDALSRLSKIPIGPVEAALIGQAAENNFVGCQCGIMDQLVSAKGEAQSALLIDCLDLTTQSVPIPSPWELLIIHSGVHRGLVESEYNQRRQQCEKAAAFFGKVSLRDLTLAQLLSAESELDPVCFRRARHVLTENARVLMAATALRTADMPQLSKVMAESHLSMRDDFEITTPAIDYLVNLLQQESAGELGVRMTGGGFGGCVIAIAPSSIIPRLIQSVTQDYTKNTGYIPQIITAKASAGAFVETHERLL
jgi:galactokinase